MQRNEEIETYEKSTVFDGGSDQRLRLRVRVEVDATLCPVTRRMIRKELEAFYSRVMEIHDADNIIGDAMETAAAEPDLMEACYEC